MKKAIIYLLLSTLLIVPIASIIVIAVINQPKNNLIEYTAVYDFEDVETRTIQIKDIEEVIYCKGMLDSMGEELFIVNYSYQDSIIKIASVDDYIRPNDVLLMKNDMDIVSELEGKIIDIVDTGSKLVYTIKDYGVDVLNVYLPVRMNNYVENSQVKFNIGELEYSAIFFEKNPFADIHKNAFQASYKVSGDELVVDSTIDIELYTGNVRKDVYVVPKQCVYKDDYGNYILHIAEGNETISIMIELGVMGLKEVEIQPLEQDIVFEGTEVTVNKENVFKSEETEIADYAS